jgi:hypothetical protein
VIGTVLEDATVRGGTGWGASCGVQQAAARVRSGEEQLVQLDR